MTSVDSLLFRANKCHIDWKTKQKRTLIDGEAWIKTSYDQYADRLWGDRLKMRHYLKNLHINFGIENYDNDNHNSKHQI